MMKFEIYSARTLLLKQKFRWRLVAENNRIVAASSEGFNSRYGAAANAKLTEFGLRDARLGQLCAELDAEEQKKLKG
jgi:uncharacterized protein YegP (UPF0339 family)